MCCCGPRLDLDEVPDEYFGPADVQKHVPFALITFVEYDTVRLYHGTKRVAKIISDVCT